MIFFLCFFLRIFCGKLFLIEGTRSGLLIKRVFWRAVLLDAFGWADRGPRGGFLIKKRVCLRVV
jgi:hypothetical protein